MVAPASLPYEEPGVVTILIHSSFLLILNIINSILDRAVYCGLLGQVLVGIAWGTPGGKLLSSHVEEVIVQLGYLGLILLVYEGGLSTSITSLKANLLLSLAVALTGICAPIALSFTLQGLIGASPLQAFAAGAALCSTSLGTTFTVLSTSGLTATRLGVVLTSAAMMDDVVGLVMVQVISNLGGSDFSAITVVRPVLVSLAFAVVAPLTCTILIKPLTLALNRYREQHASGHVHNILCLSHTAFLIHSGLLIGLVAASSYAGTSNLFAAYIAGAAISWWDSELPHPRACATAISEESSNTSGTAVGQKATQVPEQSAGTDAIEGAQGDSTVPSVEKPRMPVPPLPSVTIEDGATSGSAVYEQYYQQAVSRILKPLFFASIGFSIPITRMFSGAIVWRGIVYTILMMFGKLVCGLWLVNLSPPPVPRRLRSLLSRFLLVPHFWGKAAKKEENMATAQPQPTTTSPDPRKPFSLHPPLILALAMTARGEIGFLISAVAESGGIFSSVGSSGSESDIFLIVTWAIVLCTVLGPLGVGLSVRRVKTLELERREHGRDGRDVLGVWGVQ